MSHSRRAFLQRASAATALGLLTPLQGRRLWALAPGKILPEPDEALMGTLALTALEAARAAGASFADIRLGVGRYVGIGCRLAISEGRTPRVMWPALALVAGYGVRAIYDGAWGFASGRELTVDAVATAARAAVAGARINRARRVRTLELTSTPRVERGVWATPMERDPLTVPLGDQAELMRTALSALGPRTGLSRAELGFEWRRPTTVFASTDGTFILQRLATAETGGSIVADIGGSLAGASVGGLRQGGYGYEAVSVGTLAAEVRQAAEGAIALAQAARRPTSVEVGRYDIVLGPIAVAALLAETVATALNLDRVLGYAANRGGTSFAAPPADILGRYQMGSPLVTVRADRTQPHGAATVGWDEEGVAPEAYTLVQDGVIVDYHTSRQAALELAEWYRYRGELVRAHGCVRHTGTELPEIRLPNLTLVPGPENTTADDLIADTKRGFYIESLDGSSVDQQVLSFQCGAHYTQVRQITHGKLGPYVRNFAFQATTPQVWKSVDRLGGAQSTAAVAIGTDPQAVENQARPGLALLQPFVSSTIRTVPLRVRQVNVLNTGRTG